MYFYRELMGMDTIGHCVCPVLFAFGVSRLYFDYVISFLCIYIYALHILFCNYISFLEANHFQVSCSDSGRIYIPGTCLSSILVVEPSKTRSFLIKTKVILVAVHILMTRSFPGGMCRHSNFINSLELHTRVSWIARVSLSCSLKK